MASPNSRDNALDSIAAHRDRVCNLIHQFCSRLYDRGLDHDKSKLDEREFGPLVQMQELIDREGPAPFGTPEYKRRTAILKPMLEHHYARNSHHPEHYENGVAGMDLLDLVEMFFDWKAASERNQDAAMGITYCVERYGIDPMLASILRNTADRLGFRHE